MTGLPGFDDDKLHEECGVFGIFDHGEAAALTVLGLHALQHRGQEAAGVVTFDGKMFHSHRAHGLVGDNFSSERVITGLPGRIALGHNRYATTGASVLRNVQPLFADFAFGGLALCHNGNLTNALTLRRGLVQRGCLFQSTSDTEVIVHLIARSDQPTVVERLVEALSVVEGAYALVAMTSDAVYGVRDPWGLRPLALGKLADEGRLVLAGPFGDAEPWRGLYIFNVATVEEAKDLVETDPAVKAGIFEYELAKYYGSAALMQVNEIHSRIQKKKIQ